MLDLAASPEPDETAPHARVTLEHRLFALLPDAEFQLAPDGVPVMTMPIGDRRALIPVTGLMAELGIPHGSPDGRLLALLPRALTYVNWLRLHDTLPPEVVTGCASWSHGPEHLAVAVRRVHHIILRWHAGRGAVSAALVRAAADGHDTDEIRAATRRAFTQAAADLRMTSAGAVIAEAEALAREFAYIEALRETLLAPVVTLSARLRGLDGASGRLDLARADLRASVLRLMGRARAQLSERFAEADAVLDGDALVTLRDADIKTASLREARDALHRSRRAWTAVFETWGEKDEDATDAAGADGPGLWRRMERTYRFLAPRYMPVEEWAKLPDPAALAGRGARECVIW